MHVFLRSIKLFILMACMASVLLSCNTTVGINDEPQINTFVLEKSRNPSLATDYTGSIDQTTKTIEIALPDSLVTRSGLKATIGLSSGASLIGADERDFSISPLSISLSTEQGQSSSYLVKIQRIYPDLSASEKTNLLISEYYSGAPFSMKGSNNQYIEVTNRSGSTIDLSGYHLVRSVWEYGVRRADKDVTIRLRGTLAANKAQVIYSYRMSSAFTNIWTLPAASGQSDYNFNEFVTFSGYDGFKLVYNGEVLDVLGPGEGIGSGWNWGNQKLMVRKSGKLPSTTYNEIDWVASVSTNSLFDAANAGAISLAVPNTSADLTYFAFEGLAKRAYGIITHTPTPLVEVSVHESEGKLLSPTVSTNGRTVRYKNADIVSGTTEIDFSQPVIMKVIANDGITSKDYTINFSTYKDVEYTTTNYTFDGGIANLLARIKAGEEVFSPSVTVEGIVTARDVYFHSTAKNSFFIQDKNAGLFFFTDTALDSTILVGHKIRVEVTGAKVYYDMPEVTTFNTPTRISTEQVKIYYESDPYDSLDCLGKVYRYKGTVGTGMDTYLVGKFVDNLQYHGTSQLKSILAQDAYVEAFGPISYSYSVFRMEMNQSYQVNKL